MEQFNTSFFLTTLHLIGVAVGLGGALFGDLLFFSATRNGIISLPELRLIKKDGNFVMIGLLILIVSGTGLFLLQPEKYLASTKFLSKMAIVLVLTVNGLIFHRVHFKTMKKLVGVRLRESRVFRRVSAGLFISGAVSLTSWLCALALGSLRSLPFSVFEILSVYTLALGMASMSAMFLRRRFLQS